MKNVDEWFLLNKQYEIYIVNKQSTFNQYCIHWTSASEQERTINGQYGYIILSTMG